jgi:hypothetical protein
MKEAIPTDDASRDLPLAIRAEHRVHVLFGGTRMLQASATDAGTALAAADADTGRTGCVCYVLRTGFDSSQVPAISPHLNSHRPRPYFITIHCSRQGQMVRMIEFSSEKVRSAPACLG